MDKEKLARRIAAEKKIRSGVCAEQFGTQPRWSTGGKNIIRRQRRCGVLYHYQIHPEVGWMYARIQTWFACNVQIGQNGREWLARQMTREGLCYHQQGNCLVGIDDYPRAQALLDQQLKTDWAKLCDGLAEPLNPIPETLFEPYSATDYWTCHQSEWATDIVFRDAAFLQRLMAILVPHGMLSFSSSDVLRYFWKRVNRTGAPPASFNGDLQINLPEYRDGKRVNGLREYRPKEGGPKQDLQWRPWRKGIAGLHRRAEISQKVRRRVRALRPWGDDQDLLAAINHGDFLIHGCRHRDLQRLLYCTPATSDTECRAGPPPSAENSDC